MLRILNRASVSDPLTLKRYAPALAVRQAWPKGGAERGGRQRRGDNDSDGIRLARLDFVFVI